MNGGETSMVQAVDDPISAPDGVQQLSAGWLTDVLNRDRPGVVVTSMTVGTVIHGTATKVRLLLTYNDIGHSHRLPPTMWLKIGHEPHSSVEEMAGLYRSEAYFYRDLAPTLELGCPQAYAVQIDDHSESSSFLLEDLYSRNATFGGALEPVGPDKAALILDVLAKVHARHWNAKPTSLAWMSDGNVLDRIQGDMYGVENWNRCIALPRSNHVPSALRDREFSRAKMLKMLKHDRDNAHCVVHGDAHLGNTYFGPDRLAGYLDWQTIMWGHWAHDVSDFMTTSMTIEDRRHHERDLLSHYLSGLATAGVAAPDFDDAWLQYRGHAVYNTCWLVCHPEWQPEEICSVNTERAYAAVVDLKSFEVW